MLEIEDDIWAYWPHAWVTVPSNIGWTDSGANIMGAGLAKQAADKCSNLKNWYGAWCKVYGEATPVMANTEQRLVLFPTKPLDANQPHLSWKQPSNIDLIVRGLKQLAELKIDGEVCVPLLGCGAGGLSPVAIVPILKQYLKSDRFLLVHPLVVDSHPF